MVVIFRCGNEDGGGKGASLFFWRDEEGCVVYQEEWHPWARGIVRMGLFSNEFSEFAELRKGAGGSRGQ